MNLVLNFSVSECLLLVYRNIIFYIELIFCSLVKLTLFCRIYKIFHIDVLLFMNKDSFFTSRFFNLDGFSSSSFLFFFFFLLPFSSLALLY